MATLTKRQKQLVDFLNQYISQHGYAPTLSEIGQYFGLSSLATVHKHLRNLEAKNYIKRVHSHSRALELAPRAKQPTVREVPLLGVVAAGLPIEAVETEETISLPEELIRRSTTFCLRVKGDSMIDEGIRDDDYIVVEERRFANPGETVVALIDNEATVKKFYPQADGSVRLQPANANMQPIVVKEGDLQVRGVVVGLLRHYR